MSTTKTEPNEVFPPMERDINGTRVAIRVDPHDQKIADDAILTSLEKYLDTWGGHPIDKMFVSDAIDPGTTEIKPARVKIVIAVVNAFKEWSHKKPEPFQISIGEKTCLCSFLDIISESLMTPEEILMPRTHDKVSEYTYGWKKIKEHFNSEYGDEDFEIEEFELEEKEHKFSAMEDMVMDMGMDQKVTNVADESHGIKLEQKSFVDQILIPRPLFFEKQ